MADNIDRSEWAGRALQAFADECMAGFVSDEAVTDLICDLGHFAELELGLPRDRVLRLYSIGIGAWSAETKHYGTDPQNNDRVTIILEDQN